MGINNNTEGIEKVDLSVHCHNDLGLGVANSLAAIKAGATQIECTVNGIGERAGNAALEEVVMAISTRKDIYDVTTNINTQQIYNASRLLTTITGVCGTAKQGYCRRQCICTRGRHTSARRVGQQRRRTRS